MDYKDPMIGRMNMHKSALENVSIFISSFLRGFIFGEGSYSFFYFQSLINWARWKKIDKKEDMSGLFFQFYTFHRWQNPFKINLFPSQ